MFRNSARQMIDVRFQPRAQTKGHKGYTTVKSEEVVLLAFKLSIVSRVMATGADLKPFGLYYTAFFVRIRFLFWVSWGFLSVGEKYKLVVRSRR